MKVFTIVFLILGALGITSAFAQSAAVVALETILRDLDEMVVNERIGCYAECDTTDARGYGFGFDEVWFMGSSGDQDDDMPYEYFHYYVAQRTVTNEQGTAYVRFDLHRARSIMAVFDRYGTYALAKGQTAWWDSPAAKTAFWDDQVLLENVVRFDLYCKGWDGEDWMSNSGGTLHCFNSVEGPRMNSKLAGIPPAAIDVVVQVTSQQAAMEGGMLLAAGGSTEQQKEGRELMMRDAVSYSIRAEPITGPAQMQHPLNHYMD